MRAYGPGRADEPAAESRSLQQTLLAFATCAVIVAVTGATTNRLDISRYDWDFKYYIAIAEHGFQAHPLESPFAYRYATPFLAAELRSLLGLTLEQGFAIVAYLGAFLQLAGVFLLVRNLTRSMHGAYAGVLVVALSIFNVKFHLFDVYRPDHLAYGFVLLGFYLASRERFHALLLVTAVGAQFREFAIVPLASYLLMLALRRDWRSLARRAAPSLVCVFVAVGLPRLLIPVTHDSQYVPLSIGGVPQLLKVPFDLKRDLNFAFAILAYLLPVLMLSTPSRLRRLRESISAEMTVLLSCYTALVLLLSLYGGTDLTRFATYLFLPQAIVIAHLTRVASPAEIAIAVVGVFVFNRIWMHIPTSDLGTYLDFYGGYSDRVNVASLRRFAELSAFVSLGAAVRWQQDRATPPQDVG